MISIHYSWFIFVPIVIILIYYTFVKEYEGWELERPIFLFLLLLFIAIFGGIFWY